MEITFNAFWLVPIVLLAGACGTITTMYIYRQGQRANIAGMFLDKSPELFRQATVLFGMFRDMQEARK